MNILMMSKLVHLCFNVSAILVLDSEGFTRNNFGVMQGPTGNSCSFSDLRNHPTKCNMFLQCANHIEYEMRSVGTFRYKLSNSGF